MRPYRATSYDIQDLVVIVDDDPGMCRALADLLRSVGIDSLTFASTRELLDAALPDQPRCMVLDVRLPGINGLDLPTHLRPGATTCRSSSSPVTAILRCLFAP